MVEQGDSNSALKLLMSDQYHRNKAEVMRPVSRFQRRIDRLTEIEIADVRADVKRRETILIGSILGCLLLGLLAGVFRRLDTTEYTEEAQSG